MLRLDKCVSTVPKSTDSLIMSMSIELKYCILKGVQEVLCNCANTACIMCTSYMSVA